MRRTARAAQRLAGHGAKLLHRAAELALALVVLLAVGVALLAWRLSQGPLELGWLTHQMEAAMTSELGASEVRIGSAALVWEGFHGGVDQPLDVRLTGLRAVGTDGVTAASIPRASVSLSVGSLLIGRLVPRAIEIDGPALRVLRARDGTVSLDLGDEPPAPDTAAPGTAAPDSPAPAGAAANPFDRILTELGQAPQTDRSGAGPDARHASPLSQMRRLLIRDARMTVTDQQLGATWRAPSAVIDLRRNAQGGVSGDLDIQLALGQVRARLTATATLEAGGEATHVHAHITPVVPAVLAGAAPALLALAAIDAPVETTATLDLGPRLAIRHASLQATMGPGVAHIDSGSVALRGADLRLEAEPDSVSLTRLHLTLAPHGAGSGPETVVQASGRLRREGGQLRAQASVDLDQVAFADLPALWPAAVADHARKWVTENITSGTARQGHVTAALDVAPDLSGATVTAISAGVTGQDLTVWWLRPIPPLIHGQATLTVDTPDTMTIAVQAGTEASATQQPTGLAVHDGTVRITGLSVKDQTSVITTALAGPLPDVLAVLRHPRLHLFDKRPLDLRDPAGSATGTLSLQLPLAEHVAPEQIVVAAHAHLADVHLTGIVAGRNIDRGQVDLDVTADALNLSGQAAVAGIPAQLKVMLDFRPGPPAQVIEAVTASGRADEGQLRQAGLDSAGVLVGPTALNAGYNEHRDGSAELTVSADMAAAAVGVSALGWHKPAGSAASASLRLLLKHDRIVGIDSLRADGDGLLVRGNADFADGRPNVLRLNQAVFGKTSAHGDVRFPLAPDQPLRVTIDGAELDLSARLSETSKARPSAPKPDDAAGPPYVVDVRFARTVLAESRSLGAVSVQAESDGRIITRARVEATGEQHVLGEITPVAGGRSVSVSAGDAGDLLRALGVTRAVGGGRLAVTGRFDDLQRGHPLSGVVRMDEFHINNAPAIGKVLQGMTLYGLVDALQGPGLVFAQLVAPFRLENDRLDLQDARAFSPSLGVTVKGRADFAAQVVDLQGTIVPAYFFNSLLGNLPLVGRLFSPEKDGGVFSATYAVTGPLDDPHVSVNPLAALTPGVLRGLFGIFDQAGVK